MNNPTYSLYTAREASVRLNLHVKTVRRLIAQGKLPARRIGKEYRITRRALADFAGASPAAGADPVARTRAVLASSVVDITAISPDDSHRITTLIMAGMNTRKEEPDFPRVDCVYEVERGRLRIMITANPTLTCELLRTINALAEVVTRELSEV
jgi:excisionase family DNA binding protein